jgi:hypothetical protein
MACFGFCRNGIHHGLGSESADESLSFYVQTEDLDLGTNHGSRFRSSLIDQSETAPISTRALKVYVQEILHVSVEDVDKKKLNFCLTSVICDAGDHLGSNCVTGRSFCDDEVVHVPPNGDTMRAQSSHIPEATFYNKPAIYTVYMIEQTHNEGHSNMEKFNLGRESTRRDSLPLSESLDDDGTHDSSESLPSAAVATNGMIKSWTSSATPEKIQKNSATSDDTPLAGCCRPTSIKTKEEQPPLSPRIRTSITLSGGEKSVRFSEVQNDERSASNKSATTDEIFNGHKRGTMHYFVGVRKRS